MRFDGQCVRTGDQFVRGNENDLPVSSRRGRRDGGGRECRRVDTSLGHALANDLGTVHVHHGTIVSRHGHVDTANGGGISDPEVDARVGGDGASLGRARGQLRVDSGAAVADRGGTVAP